MYTFLRLSGVGLGSSQRYRQPPSDRLCSVYVYTCGIKNINL